MKNLVTTDWLNSHINDENIVIIDCRFDLINEDYGKNSYEKAHIPRAFYMDMNKDLAGDKKEHGGRHPLPDIKVFKEKLESMGIDNNTTIIAYDDGELAGAARFWWILKYIGHDKTYILNGGIGKWIKEKKEVGREIPSRTKKEFEIKINEMIISDMFEVKNNKDKSDVVIIDSRSADRYKGESESIDKKAGHIPGAKNYFWMDVLDEGELKKSEKLLDHFEDLTKYKKIIIHCGSGITGAVNYLALDEIGINCKLYVGSWSDWISYDDNEIALGEE